MPNCALELLDNLLSSLNFNVEEFGGTLGYGLGLILYSNMGVPHPHADVGMTRQCIGFRPGRAAPDWLRDLGIQFRHSWSRK